MLQRAGSCCAFGLEAGCFCCAYTRLVCLYSAYNRLAVQVETAVLPLLWTDSRCRLLALVTCDRRTGTIYVHKTVTAPIMLTPVTPARTALCLVGSLCSVSSQQQQNSRGPTSQTRQQTEPSSPLSGHGRSCSLCWSQSSSAGAKTWRLFWAVLWMCRCWPLVPLCWTCRSCS